MCQENCFNSSVQNTSKLPTMGAMLLSYSRQVASAMVYLSGKGYIHYDLAARNILLSVDGVCKVRLLSLSTFVVSDTFITHNVHLDIIRFWPVKELTV